MAHTWSPSPGAIGVGTRAAESAADCTSGGARPVAMCTARPIIFRIWCSTNDWPTTTHLTSCSPPASNGSPASNEMMYLTAGAVNPLESMQSQRRKQKAGKSERASKQASRQESKAGKQTRCTLNPSPLGLRCGKILVSGEVPEVMRPDVAGQHLRTASKGRCLSHERQWNTQGKGGVLPAATRPDHPPAAPAGGSSRGRGPARPWPRPAGAARRLNKTTRTTQIQCEIQNREKNSVMRGAFAGLPLLFFFYLAAGTRTAAWSSCSWRRSSSGWSRRRTPGLSAEAPR